MSYKESTAIILNTVNILYFACMTWQKLDFEQVGVDLNTRITECDYSYTYRYMQNI